MLDSLALPPLFQSHNPPQSPEDWAGWRETVLRAMQAEVYGRTLDLPNAFTWTVEVREESASALGGLARRLQLEVAFASAHGVAMAEVLLYIPVAAQGPVPCWLGLNFGGNHTVGPEPEVRMPQSRVTEEFTPGSGGRLPTEASRGFKGHYWPLELILRRGYAVATCYAGDFAPDDRDHYGEGVRRLFGVEHLQRPEDDWGNIGVWAWGLSRLYEVLAGRPEIDSGRIALVGHSRMGKAALWAGAQDERFALVVSNNSGAGGARFSRLRRGEKIGDLERVFPYWFCPRFFTYDGREQEMPVDQHLSLALVAPRPLYVASARDDAWADPEGEWRTLLASLPAWRERGVKTVEEGPFPAPGETLGLDTATAYHLRPGRHAILIWDWLRYLDFSDRHLLVQGS